MAKDKLPTPSSNQQISEFLRQVESMPVVKAADQSGRLIFAMDATASREPTWDQACHIQADMFTSTAQLGGLAIQLCYYRGFNEFAASPWHHNGNELLKFMSAVRCAGGQTQIAQVLRHALTCARQEKINALVFVGDCMEEDIDKLSQLAGELGLLSVPVFIFHEGGDTLAEATFKHLARLSGGAYCHFDAGSAEQLRELLKAVAIYAAGGRSALADFSRGGSRLIQQIQKQLESPK